MKKYSTALLFCTVLAILVVGNQLFKTPKLKAVENTVNEERVMIPVEEPVEGVEATSGATITSTKSEYTLPYPGILPTHPLYFLKELRDRIIETLIADPTRKSEFYLLQSDKWLSAGTALLEKGESEKARDILDKSGERMKMAVSQLSSVKAANQQISAGSIDKLDAAINKHLEVLENISSSSLDVNQFQQSLKQTQEEVMKLK